MNINRDTLQGAGAVLIIVAVIYLFYSPGASEAPITESTPEVVSDVVTDVSVAASKTSAPAKTAPKSGTVSTSFFKQPGSHSCENEIVTPSVRTSNIIYLADGKFRGEFRTSAVDNSSATIMVFDGLNLYTWTEGRTVGLKTKLTSLAQIPVTIPSNLTGASVVEENGTTASWNCHGWSKDTSLLKAPSYVTFYQ